MGATGDGSSGAAASESTDRADRPTRGRAARGTARDRLSAAAERMLAGVSLDDLTAFATVGRLSSEAGLSSGAIYSAHPPAPGSDRTAPQSVMRHAFLGLDLTDADVVRGVAEVFNASVASPEDASRLIESLAELVAVPVVDGVRNPDRSAYTRLWLGVAVARNDPEVAAMLRDYYDGIEEAYGIAIASILDITGRAPIEELDPRGIARLLIAAVDGAALRVRVDPSADATLVASVLLAVFAATTRRVDEEDDLFARRIAVAGDVRLGDDRLAAVAAAVRRVESAEGWSAVTLPLVAEMSGVAEVSLVAVYPTRHHLGEIVWNDVVDRVGRRAATRSSMAVDVQVVELVADLAEAACSHRLLVSSVLSARLHRTASDSGLSDGRPTDGAAALLAGVLPVADDVALVAAHTIVDALMMGAAGSDISAEELARLLTVGLASIRTRRSPSDIAPNGTASGGTASGGTATARPPLADAATWVQA